ncbi:MAG: hypothetical protein ACR5LD_06430 [Symbiopectobacterium sp.]
MLISLTQNLDKDVINNEFKHDIIQMMAMLKATESELLPDIDVRNKLNEIMSMLDSASTMTLTLDKRMAMCGCINTKTAPCLQRSRTGLG